MYKIYPTRNIPTGKSYNRKFYRSDGNSKVSARWHNDIKEIVGHYDFHLKDVHPDGGKCDFCGNNLIYVAVVDGKRIDESSHPKTQSYSLGLDCLELVFGRDWHNYREAKKLIDKLKEEAKIERRKQKNAKKFKDIIEWIDRQHPVFISSNSFLTDMERILKSGSKMFTPGMESAIRKFMDRDYSYEEYEEKIKHHREVTRPKIRMIYELVCEVDGLESGDPIDNAPAGSAYRFMVSIWERTENRITEKQLEKVEEIYKKYVAKKEKNKEEEIDTSGIPF